MYVMHACYKVMWNWQKRKKNKNRKMCFESEYEPLTTFCWFQMDLFDCMKIPKLDGIVWIWWT